MAVNTNETIYGLIPAPPAPRLKNARYRSRFHSMVVGETRRNRAPNKTMGYSKVPLKPPQEFLKKHSKDFKPSDNSTFKYPDADHRKPRVPAHTERPQLGAKSTRNFITTNAVKNVVTLPKEACPRYVDRPTGSAFKLENSGLVPKYVNKKDYGQTPQYLQHHKAEMQEAQEAYDRYVQESLRQGQMDQVEEDERHQLLQGLKKNWEDLHQQFQGLSVVTDTIMKKARKERLEAEMKQLETDIDLIERHKVIYIANDNA